MTTDHPNEELISAAQDFLDVYRRIVRLERATLILLWVVIVYGLAGAVDAVFSIAERF